MYLANDSSTSGYCYSSKASQQLTPEYIRSSESITEALMIARTRLGLLRFECDK
ncbi:hypothetical protein RGE_25650 [Rubrivivax gelatinosus IL144]|uniref:Uncharacterized protein n=1 Tax=Rubrivivax gelatinosus (strain NBRC 100245 / IL144) TaxID=983917 RepID=I0HSB7_RUBGI|nr:hypothetical protein RGE_25650 [Rubrivivax gelatinosus IL144]